jgi:CRP-like cAMP-binding protein
VAEIAATTAVGPGEVVVREGDPGDALFVVVDGRFEVKKADRVLHTIEKGAVFGELALLDGAPRAATVVASSGGKLLRIPRAEFEALLDESPELARGVIRTLLGHLRGGA